MLQSFSEQEHADNGEKTNRLLARFAKATRPRNASSDANGFVWSEYIYDPRPLGLASHRRGAVARSQCDARQADARQVRRGRVMSKKAKMSRPRSTYAWPWGVSVAESRESSVNHTFLAFSFQIGANVAYPRPYVSSVLSPGLARTSRASARDRVRQRQTDRD